MVTEAYPLQWPIGWPREKHPSDSKFRTGNYSVGFKRHSISEATQLVLHELGRMASASKKTIDHIIISTNLKYRKDGIPYSNQREPDDQGAAVYFNYKGDQMVIACDSYTKIGCNIYAIGKTIEAMRGIDRWGASELLKRAFTGFKALPEQASKSSWHTVLELAINATEEMVVQRFKELAKKYHPDTPGGNAEKFVQINEAYRDALRHFKTQ